MRNLIYSTMVSLDGFIEDSRHSLDWVLIERELHQFVNDQQAGIGAFLYGRRMYENMSAYWPTADQDPAATDFTLEWQRIWKAMPKIVFSRSLDRVGWNSRLVREDAADEVRRLKAQPGKNLAIGGASLAGSLMKQDLIDEIQLFVMPVILGSGTAFFPPLDHRIVLRLIETHTFGSGAVFMHYQKA
jgi:dihydrofolate reductase